MNLLSRLNKPEYFYRPLQVLNAIRTSGRRRNPEAIVTLPWGLQAP